MTLSPETLNAFLDDELGPKDRERVEQALAQDDAARRQLQQLRRGSALLRAALNEPLSKPLPGRVLALLDRSAVQTANTAAVSAATPRPGRQRRWLPTAVAAVLIGLAATAPASYFLAEYHVERKLAEQAALIRADYELSQAARSRALETQISGEAISWINPDSGSSGKVTPLRTFKTSEGQWCREYLQQAVLVTEGALRKAVACREADGRWRDRLEILNES